MQKCKEYQREIVEFQEQFTKEIESQSITDSRNGEGDTEKVG